MRRSHKLVFLVSGRRRWLLGRESHSLAEALEGLPAGPLPRPLEQRAAGLADER
jgi:hypothetical protein